MRCSSRRTPNVTRCPTSRCWPCSWCWAWMRWRGRWRAVARTPPFSGSRRRGRPPPAPSRSRACPPTPPSTAPCTRPCAQVGDIAVPRPGYVLTGHHMFSRYFALAPAGLPVLRLPPRREMAALQESWVAGEDRRVLFLAEPRRTDLEAVDPRARVLRGRWAWPSAAERLLSGERPSAVDLVEMHRPAVVRGPGVGPVDRDGPSGRRGGAGAHGVPAIQRRAAA